MEGENSPHSSLCVVRAEELFPKLPVEKDDDALTAPLNELSGEFVRFLGGIQRGVLAITNYRLYLHTSDTEISVPLGLIESTVARDPNHLLISCKDASTVKCQFDTFESCADWQRRITLHTGVPTNLEQLFAFPFYAWSTETKATAAAAGAAAAGETRDRVDACEWAERMQRAPKLNEDFERERIRLRFRLDTEPRGGGFGIGNGCIGDDEGGGGAGGRGGPWRVSKVNMDFQLCGSYPRHLLVPAAIDDATLHIVATYRSSRRIPAVVWRHRDSGAIMARCSQPELGWLGWRNGKDEALVSAFVNACHQDRLEILRARGELDESKEAAEALAPKKIVIIDARSYTSAVTNRARGGGCECVEYYPDADIEFMSLGNIHVVRNSFHLLRKLCATEPDNHSWLSSLERSLWLQHLATLLSAVMTVCRHIELSGRPVLVHCSDGWDRTPQILATSQLCMDPYYRTVEGFRVLVEREWLGFGHKFADRCGHGPGSEDLNERCPVFLQWLDAVHQIHRQFPCSFEFSAAYLIKLAQHSQSCIFGTFLCNTVKDRIDNAVFERTFSVWGFLADPLYRNPLYVSDGERVLWPQISVRDLVLWRDVYLGSLGNQPTPASGAELLQQHDDDGVESVLQAEEEEEEEEAQHINGDGGVEHGNGIEHASRDRSVAVGESETIATAAVVADAAKTKTRSYDDLVTVSGPQNGQLPRRCSDPNMSGDMRYHEKLPSDPSMDAMSEMSDSHNSSTHISQRYESIRPTHSQQIAAVCSTTSRMLDNLTADLQRNNGNNGITAGVDAIGSRDDVRLNGRNGSIDHDVVDGPRVFASVGSNASSTLRSFARENDVPGQLAADQNQILHSVHAECSMNGNDALRETLQTPCDNCASIASGLPVNIFSPSYVNDNANGGMDESIMIQPEFQRMDITNGGSAVYSNGNGSSTSTSATTTTTTTTTAPPPHATATATASARRDFVHAGRAQSMPTSSGHADLLASAPASSNGSVSPSPPPPIGAQHQQPSTSAASNPPPKLQSASASATGRNLRNIRSLPLTPPAAYNEPRPTLAISCPDGLAHALSEQNIRLQQLLQEYRKREEDLKHELYSTRMALVRKIPPCLLNMQLNEDSDNLNEDDDDYRVEHSAGSSIGRCSQSPPWPSVWRNSSYNSVTAMLNDAENASICSWEAVEEQRGYAINGNGTGGGASTSSNGSTTLSGSVLWVPDHAVSQCTSCQTEFWLGRRKHHCRSCGQIFCADCSEFWAALPDERLYQPVRLCGPCYHNVTTNTQMLVLQQQQQQQLQRAQQQKTKEPSALDRQHQQQQQQQYAQSYLYQQQPPLSIATPAMQLIQHHQQQQQQQLLHQQNGKQPATSNTNSSPPKLPIATTAPPSSASSQQAAVRGCCVENNTSASGHDSSSSPKAQAVSN